MKLFKPSEIAIFFGVNANTIRRYEKQGIVPLRLPSGYRKYTIQNIKDLVNLMGYESNEVKKILKDEEDM